MSPGPFAHPAGEAVRIANRRLWLGFGLKIRDLRESRRWSVQRLATAAGLSRSLVYLIEAGEPASVESAIRVAGALGLRLDFELIDPRRRPGGSVRTADPVHSFMGEFEAAHMRPLGYRVGIDEPYQHYHFAGRADVVAWEPHRAALLHLENRTRFPDFQDAEGSFNSKRAYLGQALAERAGIRR